MIPDYCEHYQLAQDPFSSGAIYEPASQNLLLEHVIHLSQFSVGFVVVSGGRGSGKSVFARRYCQRLADEQNCCLLDLASLSSGEALLQAVTDFLSLSVPANATMGELLAELRTFINNDLDDLSVTIVIDNAQLLADQTLAALVSLLQVPPGHPRAFRFVLIASDDLASRLDCFEMPDVLVQDVELPALNLADATDLLNDRMAQAGYSGTNALFNTELVRPWWQRADGDIHILLDLARLWLLEVCADAGAPSVAAKRNLPVVHLLAIAVLLAGLVMLYLYSGSREKNAAQTESQSLSLPPSRSAVAAQASSSESSAALTTAFVGPQTPEASSRVAESSASSAGTETAAAEPHGPQSQSAAQLKSEPQGKPELHVKPEPHAKSESHAKPTPAAQPKRREAPPAKPVQPLRPQASRYSSDEQEILSWPTSSYTLQVLGVSTKASAKAYIKRQSNREQLRLFSSTRKGKPWFVVIAGRYNSAAAAHKAVKSLPRRQQKAGPWARSVGPLQRAIRAAHTH